MQIVPFHHLTRVDSPLSFPVPAAVFVRPGRVVAVGFTTQVAVAEELREAGQRKIAGFAERASAAERQAREAAARLRALESGQAALRVSKRSFVLDTHGTRRPESPQSQLWVI